MDFRKTASGRETHIVEDGYYSVRGPFPAVNYSAQNTKIIKDLLMAHSDEIDKAAEEELKQQVAGVSLPVQEFSQPLPEHFTREKKLGHERPPSI
jgi:hypothetical protein